MAIELGENFTSFMKNKFSGYENFYIINADFEKYDFEENAYDLVYSAATIQWIPEEIAFSKSYQMLKPGGYLAMFMTLSDERTKNEKLYDEICHVYDEHFRVKQKYNCKLEYMNALNYGFTNLKYKEWKSERTLSAEEYISYISTHCMHITLEEPYKSAFYEGIKKAVDDAGGKITIIDTVPLYLVQKPLCCGDMFY